MVRQLIKVVLGVGMIGCLHLACVTYASDMILKSLVTINNHSDLSAVVGPEPQDPQPELIKPGAAIKDRPFAYTLFVSRFSKSGMAADAYVYYFNVTPGTNTVTLEPNSQATGKHCAISPKLTTVHCSTNSNGITIPTCHLTVTFNADNTVDFFDGKAHHTSRLSQDCRS
jgi:hypothetical protein